MPLPLACCTRPVRPVAIAELRRRSPPGGQRYGLRTGRPDELDRLLLLYVAGTPSAKRQRELRWYRGLECRLWTRKMMILFLGGQSQTNCCLKCLRSLIGIAMMPVGVPKGAWWAGVDLRERSFVFPLRTVNPHGLRSGLFGRRSSAPRVSKSDFSAGHERRRRQTTKHRSVFGRLSKRRSVPIRLARQEDRQRNNVGWRCPVWQWRTRPCGRSKHSISGRDARPAPWKRHGRALLCLEATFAGTVARPSRRNARRAAGSSRLNRAPAGGAG